MRIGVIFGCALAVVVLVVSAMNMGNIGTIERKMRKVEKTSAAVRKENAALKGRVDDLREDLVAARAKIASLESRLSGADGRAEATAREAAERFFESHKAEMNEEAVAEIARREIAKAEARMAANAEGLRAAVNKIDIEGLVGKDAVRELAKPAAQALADRAGEELGLDEKEKKEMAEKVQKGIGGFMDLMQQRRNGEITDEQFRERLRELRNDVITPEQREKLQRRFEEMRNRRGRGNEAGGGDEAF